MLVLFEIVTNYFNDSQDIYLFKNPAKREVNCENSKSDYSVIYDIIDINMANEEELCKLDGIGSAMAQNIIEYRNNNGRFNKKIDLLNVKGIGKKKYSKIEKYIEVNGG